MSTFRKSEISEFRIATASNTHAMSRDATTLCRERRRKRRAATLLDCEVAMTPSLSFIRSLHGGPSVFRPSSSDFIIAVVVYSCLICRLWSPKVRIIEKVPISGRFPQKVLFLRGFMHAKFAKLVIILPCLIKKRCFPLHFYG